LVAEGFSFFEEIGTPPMERRRKSNMKRSGIVRGRRGVPGVKRPREKKIIKKRVTKWGSVERRG
jgi:hypothetical protein